MDFKEELNKIAKAENITNREIAERVNESYDNFMQKLRRERISIVWASRVLKKIGYKLKIIKEG